MALLTARKGMAKSWDIVIRDAAGTVITPQAGDIVRVTIQQCTTNHLQVGSDAATSNGSSITTGETCQFKASDDDMALVPAGAHSFLIDYFDSADGNWKPVERHVLFVEE